MKLKRMLSAALAGIILMSGSASAYAAPPPINSDSDENITSYAQSIALGDYVVMGNYLGEDILWRCVGFGAVVTEDIDHIADGNGCSSTQTVTYTKPFATEDEAKAASSEYYPLMLSDKIPCIKQFDAKGTDTSGSHDRGYICVGTKGYYRQKYGSNYWGNSNMRDWLNSTASTGDVVWSCGNPPDEDHVWNGYNEYDQEAGFLRKC